MSDWIGKRVRVKRPRLGHRRLDGINEGDVGTCVDHPNNGAFSITAAAMGGGGPAVMVEFDDGRSARLPPRNIEEIPAIDQLAELADEDES
jgi:hypothetical protein